VSAKVQGNPAVPIAHCEGLLTSKTRWVEFRLKLTAMRPKKHWDDP